MVGVFRAADIDFGTPNLGAVDRFLRGEELTEEELGDVDSFRKNCIKYVSILTKPSPHTDFFTDFQRYLMPQYNDLFKEKLKDQKIIEIGPAINPIYNTLRENYSIASYVAVEPFCMGMTKGSLNHSIKEDDFARVEAEETDGLSYLLTQPDESAITMSFGVLNRELVKGSVDVTEFYYRFLAKEIHRVTPQDGISIHLYNECGLISVDKVFERVGFQVEKTRSTNGIIAHKN
jgi:hypothetical protein